MGLAKKLGHPEHSTFDLNPLGFYFSCRVGLIGMFGSVVAAQTNTGPRRAISQLDPNFALLS
jgi:hypothetical protein